MSQPMLKIALGIIVLLVFIYTGIPFEIEDPIVESIARMLSFALIFYLLYILFKQAKKMTHNRFRKATSIILGCFTFVFILGASLNNLLVFEKNERNTWTNWATCTNRSGIKIMRQIRETSGSIYDYRDRLVIYEFDQNNRISITTNVKNFSGPWVVFNEKNNQTENVQHLE